MKILSFVAQKGGTGKTTLALHCAVLAHQSAQVALVDLDIQRSATDWWQQRAEEVPVLVEASSAKLPEIIASADQDGYDYLMLDTPPHATYEARLACERADFMVVPCRPSALDLRAILKTIDVIRELQKPAAVVLNQCPPRRTIIGEPTIVSEARNALAGCGIPVCPYILTHRVALSYALIDGRAVTEYEPNGAAAKELKKIWNWIKEQM